MKAIVCATLGPPDLLRFEDSEVPELGPGQVRINIRAACVNFADTLHIAGKYQVKLAPPFIPGLEGAGEIVETGPAVRTLRIGQRVMVFSRFAGCFAEQLTIGEEFVVPIPDDMDFATAASFPLAYGTSHLALHKGQLKPYETLLVLGAAGGVGLAAVEIGKRMGARVIAAAGGRDKLATAREHGADETIDYMAEPLRDRVRVLTDGRGADVIYDPVGGDYFDQAIRALNWDGRLVVVGFAAGRIPTAQMNYVLLKSISLIGVVWGAQFQRDPSMITAQLRTLLSWQVEGSLRPLVSKTFPLQHAAEAMNALLSRRYSGRIVLVN